MTTLWQRRPRSTNFVCEYKFKEENPQEARELRSDLLMRKYPDHIPIIVEKFKNEKNILTIPQSKFMVATSRTMSEFMMIIRKQIKLEPHMALFVFVNNVLVPTSATIGSIYQEHRDNDGFLYMQYCSENAFGA